MSAAINPASAIVPDPITGSLSATNQSAAFTAQSGRPVRVRLSGTWTGTAKVQRSDDGGSNWFDMTVNALAWASFTGNVNEEIDDPSRAGIQYRIDFTRNSGTLVFRLGH